MAVVVVVVVHSLVVWVVTLSGLLVVYLQFRARCCLSYDNTLWPRPVPASSPSSMDLNDHMSCSLPVWATYILTLLLLSVRWRHHVCLKHRYPSLRLYGIRTYNTTIQTIFWPYLSNLICMEHNKVMNNTFSGLHCYNFHVYNWPDFHMREEPDMEEIA